jgi:tetratricopeptide (TPR) repeat protein
MLQATKGLRFLGLIAISISFFSPPALAQGMAESTSVQGAAAGLGSGIGAGAFKLFNSIGTPSAGQSGQSSSSSSSSGQGTSQTLRATPKETPAELNTKVAALSQQADAARASGDLKTSAKYMAELARFRNKHFGNKDSGAAEAFSKAGELYQSVKDYSQAEDAFKSALGFSKRINGDASRKAVPILLKLGDALAAQDRNSEAAAYYKQVVAFHAKVTDPDEKNILAARFKLGEASYKSANYKEAESLLRQAIDENEKTPVLSKEELSKVVEVYELTVKQNKTATEQANKI